MAVGHWIPFCCGIHINISMWNHFCWWMIQLPIVHCVGPVQILSQCPGRRAPNNCHSLASAAAAVPLRCKHTQALILWPTKPCLIPQNRSVPVTRQCQRSQKCMIGRKTPSCSRIWWFTAMMYQLANTNKLFDVVLTEPFRDRSDPHCSPLDWLTLFSSVITRRVGFEIRLTALIRNYLSQSVLGRCSR